MRKKEKAALIMDVLNRLYPDVPIPLEHSDAYTLLVAVVLSAQCTDARVNTVTPALFELAGTPEEMAKIPVETIREIIRPCGLSSNKSKAISNLSKILAEKYGGEVPPVMEELEKLPGVGHKTASVVVSQAFGQNAFPIDTHIHRLMTRWGLTSGKNVVQTEKDAKKIFPVESWNRLHLQIIYFGREYCPARGHDPLSCPICSQL
ncbi:MAG: endonuclease III [Spirochaetales bacterium]|nr:endonuclease III [Spirochaetales bacterium]